jgi:hypothetical protein
MACRRFNIRGAVGAVVLTCLVVAACAVPVVHVAAGAAAAAGFERPDPGTIREEAREILSQRRFSPRVSLLQRFMEWLREKLSWLKLPASGDASLAAVIFWVLVGVGAVVLVILVAFGVRWLVLYLRGERGKGFHAGPVRFERAVDRSFASLCRRMRELAGRGRYRDAVGVMMAALLRRLDEAELVAFHDSKTNGDYVVEFPAHRPGHSEFHRFALAFDGTIYGGSSCDEGTYHQMNDLFERVLVHATTGP